MSLLVVFPGKPPETVRRDEASGLALAAAQQQGFRDGVSFVWDAGTAIWYPTPDNPAGSGASLRLGGSFAAYVGTVHWQGLTRTALLKKLLERFIDPIDIPLREFSGAFAMFFTNGRDVWIFGDAVGIQKVYQLDDGSVISTSLLVCCASIREPKVNSLRAQEYVLLGGNHGLETPIQGVNVSDPRLLRELRHGTHRTLYGASPWRANCSFKTMPEAVDAIAQRISNDFRGMVGAFGTDVGMALSGGFDSRLLLAALDHIGVTPTLFVYGGPDDSDVIVAKRVAVDMGMSIRCIDKSVVNRGLQPLDKNAIVANRRFFDGLPADGIFDRGADRITRLEQVQGGRLNLNGGGGEILRNFFYLPDRVFTAEELVYAFYSNWLPRAVPTYAEREALLAMLADSVLDCLDLPFGDSRSRKRTLMRQETELVYSLLRLRFWMGRNNTVAARYGAFMTPLVHPELVSLAASLPMQWKDYGEFESSVIAALSPRVAAAQSGYGFNFLTGPRWKHKLGLAASIYRPIAFRRRSAQLRHWLGRAPIRAVPAEWREASVHRITVSALRPEYLTDDDQLNRLMTIESLIQDRGLESESSVDSLTASLSPSDALRKK